MRVPQVAIVGRPNVGKSSIFNWLAGRRISIVDPTAGVTRDRVTTLIEAGGDYFELVDTGGLGIEDRDNLTDLIEEQIELAIAEADLLLFVVDALDGLTPLDEEVARRLRATAKPVATVVNKCDNPRYEQAAAEFLRLGLGELLTVSAAHNRGAADLLDFIRRHLPAREAADRPPAPDLKLAVVGRRNAGKSTFINCLARAPRVIVSEVPGTTRDSIDVRFEKDGKCIIAIDTAGVQRPRRVKDSIAFYSLARSERSIRRADVVLVFIDPTQGVGQVDRRLVAYVAEQYKPCIFVVNKWDLMRPMPTGQYLEIIHEAFPTMRFAPIAFVTATRGRNVQAVLDLAQNLFKQAHERVSTGVLNRALREAIQHQAPPAGRHGQPNIFYATQVATAPPTLVAFCSHPEDIPEPYVRYLANRLREALPFKEVPIRLYLRQRPTTTGRGGRADREGPSGLPALET